MVGVPLPAGRGGVLICSIHALRLTIDRRDDTARHLHAAGATTVDHHVHGVPTVDHHACRPRPPRPLPGPDLLARAQ